VYVETTPWIFNIKIIVVIGVTRLFQFDCNGRHSAYQIKFKSIPGINKYWAMKVTFLAQGKKGNTIWVPTHV